MTLYAVGDLQGCLEPLEQLLEYVEFDSLQDTLWLAGDLINRGPDSIGCLKFVKSLGPAAVPVLGNHDLHVLAVHELGQETKDDDINKTLAHKDAPHLLTWLASQPLLVRDKERKLIMTHAGVPPCWSDRQARELAAEAELILSNEKKRLAFFKEMYGNKPDQWHEELEGHDRIRLIINAFTRMRFCEEGSRLEFKHKSSPKKPPENMKPWFQWPVKRKHKLVFGHWAALMGKTGNTDIIGLDTGYVWGNHLTLMNMDSGIRHCCEPSGKITDYSELEFKYLP